MEQPLLPLINVSLPPATDSSSAGSSLTGYFLGHDGYLDHQNGDKTKALLDNYMSNEEESYPSSFVTYLQTSWGVNY